MDPDVVLPNHGEVFGQPWPAVGVLEFVEGDQERVSQADLCGSFIALVAGARLLHGF